MEPIFFYVGLNKKKANFKLFFDVLLNKLGTEQLEIISQDRFLDQPFADRMKQKSYRK